MIEYKVTVAKNRTVWRNAEGQPHREDGPAIEYTDGSKWWYRNGKLHREGGPAIEHCNGGREWYRNGKCHREDGPALEWPDGVRAAWYLDGEELTEEEFLARTAKKPEEIVVDGVVYRRAE